MRFKMMLSVLAMILMAPSLCVAQHDATTETAPQFLVDAEILESEQGKTFVAARMYFDQLEQSYHVDSQRDRIDLANRTQELSVLQSKLVQFSVGSLQFNTVDGRTLAYEEAAKLLADKPTVLFIPKDAKIHPAIKALLKPETLVVSKVKGARPQKLAARP